LTDIIEARFKKVNETIDNCAKDAGVPAEVAMKLRLFDFTTRDEKTQCFTHCVFKKNDYYDKDGKFDKETITRDLSIKAGVATDDPKYAEIAKLVEKCVLEVGKNECETAFKVFECYGTLHKKKMEAPKIEDKEHLEKIREIISTCTKETGTTEEVATKLKTGDFSVDDEKAQCFVNCVFKKENFYDKDGKFDREVMIKELAKKDVKTDEAKLAEISKVLDKCIVEVGKNECDTAFKVYHCYWTNRFGIKAA
jgi:hypothetical protein